MFTSTAKIQYKNSWWVVAEVHEEIRDYYADWVRRRYGLKLMGSRWTPHITIARGEQPPNQHLWMKYQDEEWEFSYSNNVRRDRNSVFWWLDAQSDRMLDLREELGLPRFPVHSFHITVGRESATNEVTRYPWII